MIKNITFKLIFFFVLVYLPLNLTKAENIIKIKLQIENEILTNIDFLNEKNYLIALNNNLKSLPKNQLEKIARESLIREKIKKIELLKIYNFEKADKYSAQILKDFYKKLNFQSEDEFYSYLLSFNLNISDIKEKLKIETLWNEMIFKKYNNQIKIDKEKIKLKIKNQKNIINEYNLSEILFQLNSDEQLQDKYNLILKNIKNSGFKNSANIFSISDSAKFGGEIGWVNKLQLSQKITNQLDEIEIGGLTNYIPVGNSYLIIKLDNKRKIKSEIDLDKETEILIQKETDRQLNQYSINLFNKLKKNIFIYEL